MTKDESVQRRYALFVILALLGSAVCDESSAQQQKSSNGKALPAIHIIPGGWGDANVEDIRRVCLSAGGELWQFVPQQKRDPITVRYSQEGPMVIYGQGDNGQRRVLLDVKGTYWAQFAYQFGHEVCHILCNYREAENPNLWFEESLCETASLFAIRRMARTWRNDPPYPNWKSFAPALDKYARELIDETAAPKNRTLAEWYEEHEQALRKNGTDRDKNRVVAVVLLRLLEREPTHWAAVTYLNQWDPTNALSFEQYLADWHRRVPKAHKSFVRDVAQLFEIPVR